MRECVPGIIFPLLSPYLFTIHSYFLPQHAGVAELADALDSGSNECKFMWVQVPFSAPKIKSPFVRADSLFMHKTYGVVTVTTPFLYHLLLLALCRVLNFFVGKLNVDFSDAAVDINVVFPCAVNGVIRHSVALEFGFAYSLINFNFIVLAGSQ